MRVGSVAYWGSSQPASPSASASSRLHLLARAQLTVSCPDSLTSQRLASQMPRHIGLGLAWVWPSIIFTPTSTSNTTPSPFLSLETTWKREPFVCFSLFIALSASAVHSGKILVLCCLQMEMLILNNIASLFYTLPPLGYHIRTSTAANKHSYHTR